MKSLRKLIAVSTAVVALGVLAPAVSAGTQKPFHLEKVCEGTQCVVTASNFAPIPAGTLINYSGTDFDDLTAVLTIKNGTATGRCAIGSIIADPSATGTCEFAAGAGRLTQFHLDAVVSVEGTLWYWDGWYSFGS